MLLFIMMCYFFNNKKVDSNISVFHGFKKNDISEILVYVSIMMCSV